MLLYHAPGCRPRLGGAGSCPFVALRPVPTAQRPRHGSRGVKGYTRVVRSEQGSGGDRSTLSEAAARAAPSSKVLEAKREGASADLDVIVARLQKVLGAARG